MNRNKILKQIIAVLGMVATLVVAYRLDRWLIQARSPFRETRAALREVGFNSLNAFASAFVVAIGLFNLIPRRRVGS